MASKKPSSKGVANQDLQAARNELKQFRHDVSILKRKGLLDKSIDARSIKPSKYLKSQVRKFGNVLSGNASPVKVKKSNIAALKARGFTVKNGRAVVPHNPGEKVRSARGSFKVITPTRDGGQIEKLDLALDPDDINQWIDDLRNNRFPLKDDEELTITFQGYRSGAGFGRIARGERTPQQQLADHLESYDLVKRAEDGQYTQDEEHKVIDGIVIFKVKRGVRPQSNPGVVHRDEETRRRHRNRAKLARELRLGHMSDKSYEEYTRERAETEKKRRANMTDAEKAAYKAKAAARAKASRERKKTK
jgi:hypothetical protein